MKRKLLSFFATLTLPFLASSQIVINEINSDNPGGGGPGGGTDPTEFIELKGPANFTLDGYVLVFFNGFTGFGPNQTPDGTSYAAYDLDGYSTDAQGFFVLGSATTVNVDMAFPNPSNNIQNGGDAIALYQGDATSWPTGTMSNATDLVDAVVYGTNDASATLLITNLGLDIAVAGYFQQDETAQQGGGADLTLSRIPDGGNPFDTAYVVQALTPGTWNLPPCTSGSILFADSTTSHQVCDNLAGLESWTPFNGSGSSLAVVTDANGNMISFGNAESFNFATLQGDYTIRYVAYTDALVDSTVAIGLPVTGILADQCVAWSAPLTLSIVPCAGCLAGEVLAGNSVLATIVSDANPDFINWSNTSTSLTALYAYALTDTSSNFIQWITPDFDMNTLPTGLYQVWGLSYQGDLSGDVAGQNISSVSGTVCAEWTATPVNVQVLVVANVVINELNADNPGGPDTAEFIELFGDANASLDGLTMVFYDGQTGTAYAAYDLDGYTTDANGFFVMGGATVNGATLFLTGGAIQNGADAIALYAGDATSFPNGAAIATAGLLDAMVYGTADAQADNLIVGLGLDVLFPGYTQFDETAQQTGIDLTQSRVPDGGPALTNANVLLQELTPGTYNIVVLGCTDLAACNYNDVATVNDGTCLVVGNACDDADPNTINDIVTADCICVGTVVVLGCMDATACNYSDVANMDDGSCLFTGTTCDDGDSTTTNDVITDLCVCSGTPVTGIEENVMTLNVYPNPTQSLLNINFPSQGMYNLIVRNAMGQVVMNTKVSGGKYTIDTQSWNAGVWLIELKNDQLHNRVSVIKQ
jgi:hypothetical protein